MRNMMVAGNWKMNMTPTEAKELIGLLKEEASKAKSDILFCTPAIDILLAKDMTNDCKIMIGAQNMSHLEKGAYTGEISAEMLEDAKTDYVIIGHSERRLLYKEDNEVINKKILKALEHNIKPLICCGESLDVRNEGKAIEFVEGQIESAFTGVSEDAAKLCVIAYEPIWAIGTGQVATSAQAEEICKAIRDKIAALYNQTIADNMQILYGGSVSAKSAAELFAENDIDGGLVGGASLRTEFLEIIASADASMN